MDRILITGATGFLGSYLTKRFLAEGYEVGIVIRPTSNTWRLESILPELKVFDLGKNKLEEIFGLFAPNHVVHTACNYGRLGSSLSDLVETNLIFAIALLEASIANRVETFLNTDTLLPDNVNDYSLTKAQFRAWLLQKSHAINVVNLRLEHMYGPLDDENKFVFWLINQLRDEKVSEIPLTSGIQKRDFIYIDDVVNAYSLTLKVKLKGFKSFDVGTGEFVEVREFVSEIVDQLEKFCKSQFGYKLKFGLREYRENDIMIPDLDNTSLKSLGWVPMYNCKKGIEKIIN